MFKIGYCAHHEQYPPTALLEYAVLAEQSGFDTIWTADHFHPWVHSRGQCGFAWVWIAAAAERTKKVEIGTGVTCPTLRYNPAIVSQAFATLGVMYPNRIFIGLGTGEALNEMPVGCKWPHFKERADRLEEAIKIMKMLWTRDVVTFKGKYYTLRKATLYTRPKTPIRMIVAASGPTVAEIAGRYADGFLTSGTFPPEQYHQVLFPALEKGAHSVGRNPEKIEKIAEVFVSYGEDYDKALASARFWAPTILPAIWWKYPIYDPSEIEACGKLVGDDQLKKVWCISICPDDHIKHIERLIKLGFNHVYITGSNPDEKKFFEVYQKKVIPYLRETYGTR
jgi:coenzyme F420-dependent glucose-6-phosphate dehydrogenase